LEALLADPDVTTVRTVARRPLPSRPGLAHTQADLRDPAAREALAGVDVLVHLGFQLWRARTGATSLNLDGTGNVLAARPARVVLASSAAVYGAWPDNPLPITEDHVPRPNPECPYAGEKLVVERLCADAAPTTVLRIGAVLGPNADPKVARAARGYRLAVPAIRGAGEALQFLHEDDVVVALHQAVRTGSGLGVLNVATDDWLDAAGVAAATGGRVVRLPRSVMLGLSEAAFRLRLAPFGIDRAILLNGPLALDASRARTELGWKPAWTSTGVLRQSGRW